jgi:GtrA-like protein.
MNVKSLVNRETVSYTVWGILTSVLNIGLFELLLLAGTDYRVSNLVALLVTKLAAYVVNKLFVFRTKSENFAALSSEFFRFVVTRGGTMLVDWFGLILLVSVFGVPESAGKLVTTVVVVVLNYIFGKLCVFRPGTSSN